MWAKLKSWWKKKRLERIAAQSRAKIGSAAKPSAPPKRPPGPLM